MCRVLSCDSATLDLQYMCIACRLFVVRCGGRNEPAVSCPVLSRDATSDTRQPDCAKVEKRWSLV